MTNLLWGCIHWNSCFLFFEFYLYFFLLFLKPIFILPLSICLHNQIQFNLHRFLFPLLKLYLPIFTNLHSYNIPFDIQPKLRHYIIFHAPNMRLWQLLTYNFKCLRWRLQWFKQLLYFWLKDWADHRIPIYKLSLIRLLCMMIGELDR